MKTKTMKTQYPFNEGDDYWTLEAMNPLDYAFLSNNGDNPSPVEIVRSCWDDVSEEMHDKNPSKRYFKTREDASEYLKNLRYE